MHAIREIVDSMHQPQQGNHDTKKIAFLCMLDVENGSISARWDDMKKALKEFRVQKYLIRIFNSYLSERILVYDTTEGAKKLTVTVAAAQCSILALGL